MSYYGHCPTCGTSSREGRPDRLQNDTLVIACDQCGTVYDPFRSDNT